MNPGSAWAIARLRQCAQLILRLGLKTLEEMPDFKDEAAFQDLPHLPLESVKNTHTNKKTVEDEI